MPLRLLGVAGFSALVLFACFPHRLEYPAHVLAGFGMAGLGFAVVGERGSWSDERKVAAIVAGAFFAAWVWEFGTGESPDVLDVANTVMGVLLGCAAMFGVSPEDQVAPTLGNDDSGSVNSAGLNVFRGGRLGPLVGLVGCALIIVGLILRYPVQQKAEHWWWFWV